MEELKKRDLLIVAVLSMFTAGIYNLYLLFDWAVCIEALEKKIGKSCGVENIMANCFWYLVVFIYGIVEIFLPEDFYLSTRFWSYIMFACSLAAGRCLCSIPYALNSLTGKFDADALSAWILCILGIVLWWIFIFDEGFGWLILKGILDTIYFVVVQNMGSSTVCDKNE